MVKEALAQMVSVESLIQVKGMTFRASEIRNSWAVDMLNKLFSFHLMYRKRFISEWKIQLNQI